MRFTTLLSCCCVNPHCCIPSPLFVQDVSGILHPAASQVRPTGTTEALRLPGEVEALLLENVPSDALSLEDLAVLLDSIEARKALRSKNGEQAGAAGPGHRAVQPSSGDKKRLSLGELWLATITQRCSIIFTATVPHRFHRAAQECRPRSERSLAHRLCGRAPPLDGSQHWQLHRQPTPVFRSAAGRHRSGCCRRYRCCLQPAAAPRRLPQVLLHDAHRHAQRCSLGQHRRALGQLLDRFQRRAHAPAACAGRADGGVCQGSPGRGLLRRQQR
jgi:hypothetical protein